MADYLEVISTNGSQGGVKSRRLHAVDDVVPSIQSAVLQSDFSKTNDTLTAVTDLTLNLEAGKWYRVTGMFNTSADTGVQADLAGGSITVTGVAGTSIYANQANNIFGSVNVTELSNGSLGGYALDAGGSITFDVVIQVNAAGTLIPRFAQATTDPSASRLLKYSTIQAIDVTP